MDNAIRLDLVDGGSIALLTIDQPGKKVNTLGRAVLEELSKLVGQLEGRDDLKGLLLISGKPGQFIAGADLDELAALASAGEDRLAEALAIGHQLFDRIASLPFPTVSLIDGPCMGGGTELILAMDDRIASTSPGTSIGLPEVKLGLMPAWGGTQRLPRLIGAPHAIDLICSGEAVNAEKAAALGLVFDAVPVDRLVEEGVRLIGHDQESGRWRDRRDRLRGPIGLSDDQFRFTFGVAERTIRAKTKGQYPAPLAALGAIRDGCNLPLEQGIEVERRASSKLFGSPVAANLIAVFFMKNRLARDPGVADRAVVARATDRVGVLGSGQLGAGIAAASARSEIPTAMVDLDDDRLADGLQRAKQVVTSRIKIGRATLSDLERMLELLNTSTSPLLFADRDVVIEAIPENEAVKTEAYRALGRVLRDDAILATNTSTLSISRMAEAAPKAEQFIGMHFFHPVDRMELVEVVRGQQTSDQTVSTVVALAKRLRKTPIVVRDGPGFLVNRVLFPYLIEALAMLQEGVSMDAIDAQAERFGMPMGPIALLDLVGLDTAWQAGQVLADAFADRVAAPPILRELVEAGRLGKKSGAGFRNHATRRGRPEPDPAFPPFLERHRGGDRPSNDQEIKDRLILPMLLEAVRVLEEGIVRDSSDVDLGMILGIGFPPSLGGPLRWADGEGLARILDRLEPYRSLGRRFEPPETLTRMAKLGERFHPLPKVSVAS